MELKDILKKGTKAKLIQLAIDTPDFNREGVEHKTLTQEDIDTVWERAKEGGWDRELTRALYKAQDIEAMGLHTRGVLYEALYYLHIFLSQLEKTETILKRLEEIYLVDIDKEKVLHKSDKEMGKDIDNAIAGLPISRGVELLDKLFKTTRKVAVKRELTKSERDVVTFNAYRKAIGDGKLGVYMVITSKFKDYRLFNKQLANEGILLLVVDNELLVTDVLNCLDYIDYTLDNFTKHTPELLEKLNAMDKYIYLPSKEDRVVMMDYLENKVLLPKDILVKQANGKMDGEDYVLVEKGYLLNDCDEKLIQLLDEKEDKLERYVKYGE